MGQRGAMLLPPLLEEDGDLRRARGERRVLDVIAARAARASRGHPFTELPETERRRSAVHRVALLQELERTQRPVDPADEDLRVVCCVMAVDAGLVGAFRRGI